MQACILVYCKAGKYSDVTKAIRKLKGVKKAFSVFGRWDIAVLVNVVDIKTLGDLALKINGLPGVRGAETLIEVPN
ncbi:Lrp/AsnC ligand binding domain-containing protein [Candidatus Bathyarchaeota archaeon]|nr:Lrp/AsnC ligand binding domain-containing protein [Candidatus Bathyarchaeota archaeon]